MGGNEKTMIVKINNTPSKEAIKNFAKQLEIICKKQKRYKYEKRLDK